MHREKELVALNEWVPHLRSRDVGWVLTVVNKADLWWNEREAVLAYYRTGPYAQTLRQMRDLQQTVVPYCSVVHMFYESVPISGFFDDKRRWTTRQEFIRILFEAIGKGHHRA